MSNETVTLTREEFKKLTMKVVTEGEFQKKVMAENPKVAFTFMLTSIPLVAEIEDAIFGKEDNNDGGEQLYS